MPSTSEKQKKFFGAVMGAKKGQKNVSGKAKKVAKEMPKKEIKKFLKTEGEEDECWKDYEQVGMKEKKGKKVPNCVPKKKKLNESTSIHKFIESIISKNYNTANKYLKSVIEDKLEKRIQKEINTPLFR